MAQKNETVITRGNLSLVVPQDIFISSEVDRRNLMQVLKAAPKVPQPSKVDFLYLAEYVNAENSLNEILLVIKVHANRSKQIGKTLTQKVAAELAAPVAPVS